MLSAEGEENQRQTSAKSEKSTNYLLKLSDFLSKME